MGDEGVERGGEVVPVAAVGAEGEDGVALGGEAERSEPVPIGNPLCQTPLAAFTDFAAKHGVPPLRYSFEDLEEERQTADRLKA